MYFIENQANSSAAIFYSYNKNIFIMKNTTLRNNSAPYGAILYFYKNNFEKIERLIAHNSTSDEEGGIRLY